MPARLFNHGCKQNVDGGEAVNTIKACRMALGRGYEGIEVDFQYHNGSFYMDHDHFYLTNETMDMLFTGLSDLKYSIWIDLKTSNDAQLQELYAVLNKHNMINRSVVELYHGTSSTEYQDYGMRTMSCYSKFGRVKLPYARCKRVHEVSIHDRSNPKPLYVWDPKPLYVWDENSAKKLCNLHYLNEKDVILQDYNVPRPYAPCNNSIGWIVIGILCILTVSLIFRKLKNIFKTTYRYNAI